MRRSTIIAAVVLSPIVALVPLGTIIFATNALVVSWVFYLYFNVLQALLIYRIFQNTRVETKTWLLCLFFTELVPPWFLLRLQELPPWNFFYALNWESDVNIFQQFYGCFLGVGISEELCKAAILFWLVKRAGKLLIPQSAAFYGLIAGLGFGIAELVHKLMITAPLHRIADFAQYGYFAINGMFSHAIWTSIAGYFISFAALYPKRKYSLWTVAILVPALLHTISNMTHELINRGVSLLCLALLMTLTYLANRVKISPTLRNRASSQPDLGCAKAPAP